MSKSEQCFIKVTDNIVVFIESGYKGGSNFLGAGYEAGKVCLQTVGGAIIYEYLLGKVMMVHYAQQFMLTEPDAIGRFISGVAKATPEFPKSTLSACLVAPIALHPDPIMSMIKHAGCGLYEMGKAVVAFSCAAEKLLEGMYFLGTELISNPPQSNGDNLNVLDLEQNYILIIGSSYPESIGEGWEVIE